MAHTIANYDFDIHPKQTIPVVAISAHNSPYGVVEEAVFETFEYPPLLYARTW